MSLVAAWVAGSGCASEGSTCDVAADDIVIAAVVDARDGEALADVRLFSVGPAGTERSLRLCRERGDTLTFNNNSMTEQVSDGVYVYTSELPAPQGSYEIRFVRNATPHLLSAMPTAPVTLLAPAFAENVSRASGWDVAWPPGAAGDLLALDVVADAPLCLSSVYLEVPDTGSATVPAGALVAGSEDYAGQSCVATVRLRRSAPGSYPDALAPGGQMVASDTAEVVVRVAP